MQRVSESVEDLVFELKQPGQPRLCFGVCDESNERRRLSRKITYHLKKAGIRAVKIRLSANRNDLVESIKDRLDILDSAVVIVDWIGSLSDEKATAAFMALNFKRDILFKLGISVLFWISSEMLHKLVSIAPDFWSRRSYTHYFDAPVIPKLLARLFGDRSPSSRVGLSERKIVSALQIITLNERSLNEALDKGRAMYWLEAEHCATKIAQGTDALISLCHKSKSIHVTWSLWNLAKGDELSSSSVYQVLRAVEPVVGVVYDDRDSIILILSKRLPDILARYRDNLLPRFKKGKKNTLLGYFATYVKYVAREWSTRAMTERTRARQKVSISDESLEEAFADETTIESRIAEKAAEQLTDWLEGQSVELPAVFSKREGDLLRFLYKESRVLSVIAKRFKTSRKAAMEEVYDLEAKVRALFEGLL